MEEKLILLLTNRLFSNYIPTGVVQDYEIKNLASAVNRFTTIYLNELNKIRGNKE